jgi:hypothetical protein
MEKISAGTYTVASPVNHVEGVLQDHRKTNLQKEISMNMSKLISQQ